MGVRLRTVLERDAVKDRFFHRFAIPLLSGVLWAIALFVSLKVSDSGCAYKSLIEFLSIFLVLFLEAIIILLDTYVDIKAYYLKPGIIIPLIALVLAVVLTSVCVGIYSATDHLSKSIFWIIGFSALVKILGAFITNNSDRYLVKIIDVSDCSISPRDIH